MHRDIYSYLVANPGQVSPDDVSYLEQLVEHYPFCQTGHVLLAKGHTHRSHSQAATAALRKAAVYALSRNALRKLMGGEFPPVSVTRDTILPFVKRYVREQPKQEEIDPVQALRGLDYSEVLLKKAEELTEKKPEKKADVVDHTSLIDRFIQDEPRIAQIRPKVGQTEEEPVDLAAKNKFNDNSPVTEAYAKILARQGKTEKAVVVYEKLQLKFPEKKAYFAEKIAEIRGR
ncbi:MAG: hypothetical protein J7576_10765 [Siphonobacter aquaeclarae]|nr:hypothetical protein [Siphonobacter aquaeclarae]